MKRLTLLLILISLAVYGINAQVLNQGTIALISTNPAADPFLCIFGNTTKDVTIILSDLDINGKQVLFLRNRDEVNLPDVFKREMSRLNSKFLAIHTVQRALVSGTLDIRVYYIVDIYEREGNKYYCIASNNY